MKGVTYIMDDSNKKVAVQINLKVLEKYDEEIEDLIDGIIAESRKDEQRKPLDEVIKEERKTKMKAYKVVLTESAEKELQKLPAKAIAKLTTLLQSLENNPRPLKCKKLKGYKNLWRVRTGDYRII